MSKKWSEPKGKKPVPKFKNIDGKRYSLSSQDIGKSEAKKLAKKLRANNRFLAQVIPMKGSYRVYSKRRK